MRKLGLLLVLACCLMQCRNGVPPAVEAEQELEPTRVTLWDADVELFIEYEPFIAGAPTRFVTHVTHLDGWRARDQGEIRIELSKEGAQPLEVVVDKPARRGIYLPDLTFPSAGLWRVDVQVPIANGFSTQTLPYVTVYPSSDAIAGPSTEATSAPEAISFLKEQQWIIPFATEAVALGSFRASFTTTGRIVPKAGGMAVVQAPVTGRILPAANFPFRGAEVTKGKRLASLLPRPEQTPDPSAFALAVTRAEQRHDFATKELTRIQNLFEQQAVPENRLRQARFEADQAQIEWTQAQARLKQFQALQTEGATPEQALAITAPLTGTLLDVQAVPGGLVFEGAQLFRIADIREVWLECAIPEADLHKIAKAAGAWFTVTGLEGNFETDNRRSGPVVEAAEIDPQRRTLALTFAVANPEGTLKIGMAAKVAVTTGETASGPGVPASALMDENGLPIVYVQKDGEAFERRRVTLGLRDGDTYQVTSGLAVGERIVTKGAYQIRLASTSTNQAGPGHVH